MSMLGLVISCQHLIEDLMRSGAKKEGSDQSMNLSHPDDWSEVILKGLQIRVRDPYVQAATDTV